MVYVKNTFNYEHILDLESDIIQSIWIRGYFKKSKDISFCHAYREHMGDFPIGHQRNMLEDLLNQWETALEFENLNIINEVHMMQDMHLDSLIGKWLEPAYKMILLSRLVQNFCDIGNFSQLVTEPTRIMHNSVKKTVEVSCIDNIYNNTKHKCSSPTVTSFGASDHDIISYTRFSKDILINSTTKRGRSYKYFKVENFLQDLPRFGALFVSLDLNIAVKTFFIYSLRCTIITLLG